MYHSCVSRNPGSLCRRSPPCMSFHESGKLVVFSWIPACAGMTRGPPHPAWPKARPASRRPGERRVLHSAKMLQKEPAPVARAGSYTKEGGYFNPGGTNPQEFPDIGREKRIGLWFSCGTVYCFSALPHRRSRWCRSAGPTHLCSRSYRHAGIAPSRCPGRTGCKPPPIGHRW
jgi:hypothetical protein